MQSAIGLDESTQKYWSRLMQVNRVPHDQADREFVQHAVVDKVTLGTMTIDYFTLGQGPVVLLVHGMYSNYGNMIPLARALLQENYRVLLFDAPAHGDSPGGTTDTVEAASVILEIANKANGIDYVVAHSQGGVWASYALMRGLRLQGLALIGAPATHRTIIDKFASMHKLDEATLARLEQRIEAEYGSTVWQDFSPSELLARSNLPGLILHCLDDRIIPAADARVTHNAWPGSQLHCVSGLGHFDTLKSTSVVAHVVDWLKKLRQARA